MFTRDTGASPNQMRVDLADKRKRQAQAAAKKWKALAKKRGKKLKSQGKGGKAQSQKGQSQRAKNWDESKHPRVGAGSPMGGTFAKSSGKGSSQTATAKPTAQRGTPSGKKASAATKYVQASHLKNGTPAPPGVLKTRGGKLVKKTAKRPSTTEQKAAIRKRLDAAAAKGTITKAQYDTALAKLNGQKLTPAKPNTVKKTVWITGKDGKKHKTTVTVARNKSAAEKKAGNVSVKTKAHQALLRTTASANGWHMKNGKYHTEYLDSGGNLIRVDFTAGPNGITAREEESGKTLTSKDARKIVAFAKKKKVAA